MAIKIKGLDAVQEVDKRTELDHMRIDRARAKRERRRQIQLRLEEEEFLRKYPNGVQT